MINLFPAAKNPFLSTVGASNDWYNNKLETRVENMSKKSKKNKWKKQKRKKK